MKVPTPQQLGLPEKFDSWRPVQEQSLSTLIEFHAKKRTIALCSPTGSGKSPVAVAAAVISKLPTCIVTQTKALQDQYMKDFSSMGMVDLRGRDNYPCTYRDDYTCEQGYTANCPYRGTGMCPSSAQEMKAALSTLVVMNYKKWTSSKKFGMGLDHFQQVIFDEGHSLPDALADAMQITLHHPEVEHGLGMDFPPNPLDMASWRGWAVDAKVEAEIQFVKMRDKINATAQPRASWLREYTHLRNMIRKLSVIITASPDNWIVDEIEDGYVFDPLWPGRYAESMMFFKIPHIIIKSATLRKKTLHISGIGKGGYDKITRDSSGYEIRAETENYVFEEYDSDFDPKDCPTYYIPAQFVDRRHSDMSQLFLRIDQWCARRQDRKGIIHTISHDRRAELVARSMFRHMMIYNDRGETTTKKIEEFRECGPGALLVSPSISTGYDFPDTDCEHSIMCKIPFLPPSKIVKAREAQDKEYRAYKAVQYMVQGFGRHIRRKGDRGEGAIFDRNMEWFWPQFRYLAPRSFHATFKPMSHIPEPLPKL